MDHPLISFHGSETLRSSVGPALDRVGSELGSGSKRVSIVEVPLDSNVENVRPLTREGFPQDRTGSDKIIVFLRDSPVSAADREVLRRADVVICSITLVEQVRRFGVAAPMIEWISFSEMGKRKSHRLFVHLTLDRVAAAVWKRTQGFLVEHHAPGKAWPERSFRGRLSKHLAPRCGYLFNRISIVRSYYLKNCALEQELLAHSARALLRREQFNHFGYSPMLYSNFPSSLQRDTGNSSAVDCGTAGFLKAAVSLDRRLDGLHAKDLASVESRLLEAARFLGASVDSPAASSFDAEDEEREPAGIEPSQSEPSKLSEVLALFEDELAESFKAGTFCDNWGSEPAKLTVVIPVHENGRELATTCLPSLMSNSLWPNMEILVVDDASRDELTRDILNTLERLIRNVTVIRLSGAPSGSASRPRNVGLKQARGEYVAFLDPDNRISHQGYDKLYELVVENHTSANPVDFVTGYQLKFDSQTSINSLHSVGFSRLAAGGRNAMLGFNRFPTISTQAALMRAEFLRTNALTFVDGAVGQDTLFGWEVLVNSAKTIFTSSAHIAYFSQRARSVTNDKSEKFLQRSLIRERAQVDFLNRYELLKNYKESSVFKLRKQAYRARLASVPVGERETAAAYVQTIDVLYG